MSDVRIRSTGAMGEYEVSLFTGYEDAAPVYVVMGRVQKREERFNLRRLIVARYWRAFPATGVKDETHYPTRRDAVAAIVNV